MSHYSHIPIHAPKKPLEKFYWMVLLRNFGMGLITVFLPIYLYVIGYTLPEVLFYMFLESLAFVLLAYPVGRVIGKQGVKYGILFSTPFYIAYYLLFSVLPEYAFLYWVLPWIGSMAHIAYNVSYHFEFAHNIHDKKQGREVSMSFIITGIAAAIAPFLGGVLAEYDFSMLYILGSILLLLGALPVISMDTRTKPIHLSYKRLLKEMIGKSARRNSLSFASYAFESVVGRIIWPIFLYVLLGSLSITGSVVGITLLLSLFFYQLGGKLTDIWSRVRVLRIATLLHSIGWIARIFVGNIGAAIVVDTYKNISEKVLHIPWAVDAYVIAKREGVLHYVLAREVIFNLTRLVGYPILIVIFTIGYHPYLIAFALAAFASLGYVLIENAD